MQGDRDPQGLWRIVRKGKRFRIDLAVAIAMAYFAAGHGESERLGRELKEIREKLRELKEKRTLNQRDLTNLTEQRQKLFGDVALGLADPQEKPKINQRIIELEAAGEDLDITIKELEARETRLDRGGYGKIFRH